jgi:hypothetical protein
MVVAGADRPLRQLWVNFYRLDVLGGLEAPEGDLFEFGSLSLGAVGALDEVLA